MCLKAGNSWFWRDFILANWESDCGKVGVALLAWPFKTTSKEKCTCIEELGSDGALKPPLPEFPSQAIAIHEEERTNETMLCSGSCSSWSSSTKKNDRWTKNLFKIDLMNPPACIQLLPPFLQCLTCRKKKARLNVIDQIITRLK